MAFTVFVTFIIVCAQRTRFKYTQWINYHTLPEFSAMDIGFLAHFTWQCSVFSRFPNAVYSSKNENPVLIHSLQRRL